MKAVVYTEYGDPGVLKIKEIAKPVPKDNEVLIKVFATSVNYGEIALRNFKNISFNNFNMPFLFLLPSKIILGMRKPKRTILGSEFAGEIESIGRTVKRFKTGEQVFGYRGMNVGANAEYITMSEDDLLTIKPANISYEEAATIPYGALTALNVLRKIKAKKNISDILEGKKVLIIGASGSIGSGAVQLAKYYGADVTGICGTPRLEFVKSLGADKVIDYSKEDFTQNGETYDIILDVLGRNSFSKCKASLKENGILLCASFKTIKILQMLWTSLFSDKKVICALSSYKQEDILLIKELIEKGKIKSIVDKSFPMEQAAEAHRYYESGDRKGEVTITLGHLKNQINIAQLALWGMFLF